MHAHLLDVSLLEDDSIHFEVVKAVRMNDPLLPRLLFPVHVLQAVIVNITCPLFDALRG